MPADQRVWLHHGEYIAPGEQSGQQDQAESGSVSGSVRLRFALRIERQLLAEKQVLSNQAGPRSE